MRSCAGVSFRGAPRLYCLSRKSNGTRFAAATSSTIIDSKRCSSGQKNMLAVIDANYDSLTVCTSPWSKWHFRSASHSRGYLRLRRTDDCSDRFESSAMTNLASPGGPWKLSYWLWAGEVARSWVTLGYRSLRRLRNRHAIAPAAFGFIQSLIGRLYDLLQRRTVFGESRNSDANGHLG